MCESTKHFRCCWVLAIILLTAAGPSGAASAERGQYGADLSFLRKYYTPPADSGESNHYIDLWAGCSLSVLARVNGLTNNHALFVDSHGKAGCTFSGSGYGMYPKEELLEAGQRTPYFSVQDLATVLGPIAVASIHNVVMAGCNEQGRFNSQEVRRYFPNATNVTYMAPGCLAYKPMFYQAIVLPSSEIKPIYGKARMQNGRVECDIVSGPVNGARVLGAYVADLYLPGARKPFRTQMAGRELLDPSLGHPVISRDAALAFGASVSARTVDPTHGSELASEIGPGAQRRPVAPIIMTGNKSPAPEVAERSSWEVVRQFLLEWMRARPVR